MLFGKGESVEDKVKKLQEERKKHTENTKKLIEKRNKEIKELELIEMVSRDNRFALLKNEMKLEIKMMELKDLCAGPQKINKEQINAVCSYLEQGVSLIDDIIKVANS